MLPIIYRHISDTNLLILMSKHLQELGWICSVLLASPSPTINFISIRCGESFKNRFKLQWWAHQRQRRGAGNKNKTKNKKNTHCCSSSRRLVAGASLRPKTTSFHFPETHSLPPAVFLCMWVALTSIERSWVTACQREPLVLLQISCAIFLLYKTPVVVCTCTLQIISQCLYTPPPSRIDCWSLFLTSLKNNKTKIWLFGAL